MPQCVWHWSPPVDAPHFQLAAPNRDDFELLDVFAQPRAKWAPPEGAFRSPTRLHKAMSQQDSLLRGDVANTLSQSERVALVRMLVQLPHGDYGDARRAVRWAVANRCAHVVPTADGSLVLRAHEARCWDFLRMLGDPGMALAATPWAPAAVVPAARRIAAIVPFQQDAIELIEPGDVKLDPAADEPTAEPVPNVDTDTELAEPATALGFTVTRDPSPLRRPSPSK